MKKILLGLTLLIIAIACKPSLENEIAEHLQKKYNEKFIVTMSVYSYVLKRYSFRAYSRKNKQFKLQGSHNETFSWFNDNYASVYLSMLFTNSLQAELHQDSGDLYVYGNVGTDNDLKNAKNFDITTLQIDKTISEAKSSSFSINCYIFGSYKTAANKYRLKLLYEKIQRISMLSNSYISLDIYFCNPDFLKKNSFDDFIKIQHKDEELVKEYLIDNFSLNLNTKEPFKKISYLDFISYLKSGSYRRYPLDLNRLMLVFPINKNKMKTFELKHFSVKAVKKLSLNKKNKIWYLNNKQYQTEKFYPVVWGLENLKAQRFLEPLAKHSKISWKLTVVTNKRYTLSILTKHNNEYICKSSEVEKPFILKERQLIKLFSLLKD